MAQTRRTISVTRALYLELQAVCIARGQPVSQVASELIRAHIDALERTTSAPSTEERLDALERRVFKVADYRPDDEREDPF